MNIILIALLTGLFLGTILLSYLGWSLLRRILSRGAGEEDLRDPAQELEELIAELTDELVELRKLTAMAIQEEKRLRRLAENDRGLAEDWARKVSMAIALGRDDLARDALERQREHEERAEELEQTLQEQGDLAAGLRAELKACDDRLQRARRERMNLRVREQRGDHEERRKHDARRRRKVDDLLARFDALHDRDD